MDEGLDLISNKQVKESSFRLKYRGPFGKERTDLNDL